MCGTTTIETEVTARIDKRGPNGEDASIAQFVASAALAIAARADRRFEIVHERGIMDRVRAAEHDVREARRTQSPRHALEKRGVLGREIAGHGQRSRLARHERERPQRHPAATGAASARGTASTLAILAHCSREARVVTDFGGAQRLPDVCRPPLWVDEASKHVQPVVEDGTVLSRRTTHERRVLRVERIPWIRARERTAGVILPHIGLYDLLELRVRKPAERTRDVVRGRAARRPRLVRLAAAKLLRSLPATCPTRARAHSAVSWEAMSRSNAPGGALSTERSAAANCREVESPMTRVPRRRPSNCATRRPGNRHEHPGCLDDVHVMEPSKADEDARRAASGSICVEHTRRAHCGSVGCCTQGRGVSHSAATRRQEGGGVGSAVCVRHEHASCCCTACPRGLQFPLSARLVDTIAHV